MQNQPQSIAEYEKEIERLKKSKTKNSRQAIEQLKTNLNRRYANLVCKIATTGEGKLEGINSYDSLSTSFDGKKLSHDLFEAVG